MIARWPRPVLLEPPSIASASPAYGVTRSLADFPRAAVLHHLQCMGDDDAVLVSLEADQHAAVGFLRDAGDYSVGGHVGAELLQSILRVGAAIVCRGRWCQRREQVGQLAAAHRREIRAGRASGRTRE